MVITKTLKYAEHLADVEAAENEQYDDPEEGQNRMREVQGIISLVLKNIEPIENIFLGIEGNLLKKQRKDLLEIINSIDDLDKIESLEGLFNLLNYISDIAHDQYGKDCLLEDGA